MIDGFEDIVYDLTEEEKLLVPGFVASLKKRIGFMNAITASEITRIYKERYDIEIPGPRVRKIINYIRNHYMVLGLMATSKGYYVSQNINELVRYSGSLRQREQRIADIRKKLDDYILVLIEKEKNGKNNG